MTALDSLFSRQPWLITSEAMHSMAAQAVAFFDARLTLPEPSSNPLLSVEDGVGIIRIHGPLMRDPDLISSLLFGATDMNQVAEAIQEAVARDEVKSILLDIDSPGGTVNGTPELAQAVADQPRRPQRQRQHRTERGRRNQPGDATPVAAHAHRQNIG